MASVASAPFSVKQDSKDIELQIGSSCDKQHQQQQKLAQDLSVGKLRMVDMALRSFILAFATVSLSFMLASTQNSAINVFGFSFTVSMKWSRTQPYLFLVIVQTMICIYAFLQFIYQSVVIAKRLPLQRRCMWLQLAADQACVYLVLAAAAAAAGASRMNKTGFQNLGLGDFHIPPVCSVLDRFCMRATIAIICTLLVTLGSSICAALDVYMLTLTY